MLIAQRINDYITAKKPDAFCDTCIADELDIRHSQANHTTRALGTTNDFKRAAGVCSLCKSDLTVISRV